MREGLVLNKKVSTRPRNFRLKLAFVLQYPDHVPRTPFRTSSPRHEYYVIERSTVVLLLSLVALARHPACDVP